MVGTSFSSFPNAPGAPSGQRGIGSLISACIETEKATSAARSKLVFMARVVGYFDSEAELNKGQVAFNEETGNGRGRIVVGRCSTRGDRTTRCGRRTLAPESRAARRANRGHSPVTAIGINCATHDTAWRKGLRGHLSPERHCEIATPRYAMELGHSPVQCINRSLKQNRDALC